MNDSSPLSYAKSIAYLRDASTIRAHVLSHFGRAPKLEAIEQIVAKTAPKQSERFECGHLRHEPNQLVRDGKMRCRRCYNDMRNAAARNKRYRDRVA